MRIFIFIASLFYLIGCTSDPSPIHFGEDDCENCRMIISDSRYGGELISEKGKIYKFDSIECMAAYILKDEPGSSDYQSIWSIDFNQPQVFIDASQAWYLHSEILKSPMGLNFSAFANKTLAETVKNVYPGEIKRWDEVKIMVKEKWLN